MDSFSLNAIALSKFAMKLLISFIKDFENQKHPMQHVGMACTTALIRIALIKTSFLILKVTFFFNLVVSFEFLP